MSAQMIPLRTAFFCCACDVILDSAQVCPSCDSGSAIASLGAWLKQRTLQDVFQALNMASAVMAPKEARVGNQ
jgi:hypothetical protein